MSRPLLRVHALTVAWSGFLALLLLLPANAYNAYAPGWLGLLRDGVPQLDKLIHTALFAVMALLARRSLLEIGDRRSAVWAALLASLYGVVLELLQGPIPGRATGVLDMIANTVGAVGGAIMAVSLSRSSTALDGKPLVPGRGSVAGGREAQE